MYKKSKAARTTAKLNQSTEGESIEMRVRRIVHNREPITDGAPLIFTERSEGVVPNTDIRTDKWEQVVEATDKITQQKLTKREERHKSLGEQAKEGMNKEGNGDGAEAAK